MIRIKKHSLALIIGAAIIIEALGVSQYFMARRGTTQEVLAKAERDMKESQRVAVVKAGVETALKNAEPIVRLSLGNSETSYSIATRIINVNQHIIGVGIAFVPGYYKDKGRGELFMPYTYDDQPSIIVKGKRTDKSHIQTTIPDIDYTKREWYQTAIKGERKWCEPYVGQGGINVLMCTYSIPVKDKSGRLAGVLFANVTMEDATVLLNNFDSRSRKSSLIVLIIQLSSLLLMCIIIWYAATASRRNKVQGEDPEKLHLAEQLTKLKEVNSRLTKRNQELAEKVSELQRRIASTPQHTDQHWFG